MNRCVAGIFVLLLALPAVAYQQDSNPQSATPAEQYQALLKEAEKAQADLFKALSEAPVEDVLKVFKEKAPNFSPKFLALAEKYSTDPVALDALIWVVSDSFGPKDGRDIIVGKALTLLLRDHVRSEKLGQVCENLGEQIGLADPTAFFEAVMERNPHKEVQAEACLALAYRQLYRALIAEGLKKDPNDVKQLADALGKDVVTALQNENVDKLRSEGENYFVRFAEKYSGVLSAKRLARVCEILSIRPNQQHEKLLRILLAKDARNDVQGIGTLQLATLLRERGDTLQEQQPKEAAKLYAESETLLEKAADKYADVEMNRSGTVGNKAKKELFALRYLSIGKVAPDIDGEDQLGKRFNLSDYRGKVVLVDFWSQH